MVQSNRVDVFSKNNKLWLAVDGVVLKRVQKWNIGFDVDTRKALVSIELICDLNTKEQPIAEVAQSVE